MNEISRKKKDMDEIKKENKDMQRQNISNLQTISEKKLVVNMLSSSREIYVDVFIV